MKQMAKYTIKERRSFGVLGIACIPELTWGMRNCRKNNIPVIGIPLNANRCIRWFGEFFPNSVDLTELEKLISEKEKYMRQDPGNISLADGIYYSPSVAIGIGTVIKIEKDFSFILESDIGYGIINSLPNRGYADLLIGIRYNL